MQGKHQINAKKFPKNNDIIANNTTIKDTKK